MAALFTTSQTHIARTKMTAFPAMSHGFQTSIFLLQTRPQIEKTVVILSLSLPPLSLSIKI